jgi:hypothetical protein
MERLADLRPVPLSLDDATAIFNRLAERTLVLEARNASFEKRVARLKAQHEESCSKLVSDIDDHALALTSFIETNRGLFNDPRKVKTSLGSFGLQTVSELKITDEDLLVQHLLGSGYDDCYEVVRKPIKAPVKARIKTGETIPGAIVVEGDTAVYKVDRALIAKARECESAE